MDVVPHGCRVRPKAADSSDGVVGREGADTSDQLRPLRLIPLTVRTVAGSALVPIHYFSLRRGPLAIRQTSATRERCNVPLLQFSRASGPAQSGRPACPLYFQPARICLRMQVSTRRETEQTQE